MIDLFFILTVIFWIFVTATVGLVTAGIVYARWNYGVLEKTPGLTGVVPPAFIGGSDPFIYKKVTFKADMENAKKYGPIYGYYEGRTPQIFVTDPDIIRSIFIKDAEHFPSKIQIDGGHELFNEMMDILPYEKWKAVRSQFTPLFTTSKIRGMHPIMTEAVNEWFAKVKERFMRGDKFVPKQAFIALTTDVIARCAFGTKINAFDDPNNTFLKYIKMLGLDDLEMAGPILTVVSTFPFIATWQPFIPIHVLQYFSNLTQSMLEKRREESSTSSPDRQDIIQVMMEMMEKCRTEEYGRLGISETTVMSQSLTFLLAGFEGSAATMTNMCLRLAKHPKVQDRLLEELDAFYERHGGRLEAAHLGELVYLSATINETLRMHATVNRVDRVCAKEWRHPGSGLVVKKGTIIQVPTYAVHFDPANFEEPNEFMPERFLAENKGRLNQYAFLAFGLGHHNCLGAMMAREEIQLTMATLLKEFRVENVEGADFRPKIGTLFFVAHEPFNLGLVKRNQ